MERHPRAGLSAKPAPGQGIKEENKMKVEIYWDNAGGALMRCGDWIASYGRGRDVAHDIDLIQHGADQDRDDWESGDCSREECIDAWSIADNAEHGYEYRSWIAGEEPDIHCDRGAAERECFIALGEICDE